MKRIFAAIAMTAILAGCGSDNSGGEAEEQAAVAEALEEQQVQVAQSMQDRWNDRLKSADTAEKDEEGTAARAE
jgi:hypothetical protein